MNETVRKFWAQRASEARGSVRWTGEAMLEEDGRVILSSIRRDTLFSWLDVGCGAGDLQRRLQGSYSYCLAVDAEAAMGNFFPVDPQTTFFVMEAGNLTGRGDFDLVTAFGLVTCLAEAEERELYRRLQAMTTHGVVLVKNQCSRDKEKIVDHFSPELNAQYWARYPTVEQQSATLRGIFSEVEFRPYPTHLNKHEGTFHGVFICRNA